MVDMNEEEAIRLIGREAGSEMAFSLADMAVTKPQVSNETQRIVMGIIDDRRRRFPSLLSDPVRYDQFIDSLITTYKEANPRISKSAARNPLQPA